MLKILKFQKSKLNIFINIINIKLIMIATASFIFFVLLFSFTAGLGMWKQQNYLENPIANYNVQNEHIYIEKLEGDILYFQAESKLILDENTCIRDLYRNRYIIVRKIVIDNIEIDLNDFEFLLEKGNYDIILYCTLEVLVDHYKNVTAIDLNIDNGYQVKLSNNFRTDDFTNRESSYVRIITSDSDGKYISSIMRIKIVFYIKIIVYVALIYTVLNLIKIITLRVLKIRYMKKRV